VRVGWLGLAVSRSRAWRRAATVFSHDAWALGAGARLSPTDHVVSKPPRLSAKRIEFPRARCDIKPARPGLGAMALPRRCRCWPGWAPSGRRQRPSRR
jgi:hypothetical protein